MKLAVAITMTLAMCLFTLQAQATYSASCMMAITAPRHQMTLIKTVKTECKATASKVDFPKVTDRPSDENLIVYWNYSMHIFKKKKSMTSSCATAYYLMTDHYTSDISKTAKIHIHCKGDIYGDAKVIMKHSSCLVCDSNFENCKHEAYTLDCWPHNN